MKTKRLLLPLAGMDDSESTSGAGVRERLLPNKPSKKGSYLNEVLFGLINVIVGVPTMVSYAAVVFKVSVSSPALTLCLLRRGCLLIITRSLRSMRLTAMPLAERNATAA